MGKTMRTIYIDIEIDNKLKTESNISNLIETLLRKHYDFEVLHKHLPNLTELDEKAKELNLQLEKVSEQKKDVLTHDEKMAKLKILKVVNPFLIDRLRLMKEKPNVLTINHLKKEYSISEAISIWRAWDILHGKEPKEE